MMITHWIENRKRGKKMPLAHIFDTRIELCQDENTDNIGFNEHWFELIYGLWCDRRVMCGGKKKKRSERKETLVEMFVNHDFSLNDNTSI